MTTKYQIRVDDILWEIEKYKDFKYEQNSDIAWKGCNLLSKAMLKPQVWIDVENPQGTLQFTPEK